MIDFTEPELNGVYKSSTALVRVVGYGLLLISLIDYIQLFVPLRLMNPAWELQTILELVGQVAAPLVGLVFVFYGQLDFRAKREIVLLKVLSWSAFVIGILYFFLLPLLVVSNIHLDSQLNEQVATQVDQRTEVIERVGQQLSRADTKQELQSLFTKLSGQALPPALQQKSAPELKTFLSQQLSKAKTIIRPQTESIAQSNRMSLLKKTIKLLIEILICGTIFIYIWHLTKWARRANLSLKN